MQWWLAHAAALLGLENYLLRRPGQPIQAQAQVQRMAQIVSLPVCTHVFMARQSRYRQGMAKCIYMVQSRLFYACSDHVQLTNAESYFRLHRHSMGRRSSLLRMEAEGRRRSISAIRLWWPEGKDWKGNSCCCWCC